MSCMSRTLSLFVSLMLFLALGLAQAPRVCVGDGHGGACRAEACACVAACSCHEAHDRAVPECCMVDDHAQAQAQAGACHGPNQFPHFAPADRHWFALAPIAAEPLRLERPDARAFRAVPGAIAALLAIPDEPPRRAA